jgi:hypothetical protein
MPASATLGSTITAGLYLWGSCESCRREIKIETAELEALAAKYGRDAELYPIMQRIKCRDCGGKTDFRLHPYGAPKVK